jgi:urease accessory protein
VLVHPPGGLVGGDSLEIDIRLGRASHVLCTTPGAQKWYRSASAQWAACSGSRIVLGDGAFLEWLPQPAIVYDGARAEQRVGFELAGDARMIGWECLVLGRRAMGEHFQRGSLRQRLSLAVDGRSIWTEQTRAEAGDRLFASPLGWRGNCVAGTVWALGHTPEPLLSVWRDILAQFERQESGARSPFFAGAATRPGPGLLLARLLGDDVEQLMNAARMLWAASRRELLGSALPAPRIWAT